MAAAAEYVQVAQQIYVAYFGRPADLFGLNNMIANLAASNAPTSIAGLKDAYKTNGTVKAIIDNFGSSPESQALYAGADDAAFITAIYQNVLNRDPLIGGLTFWVTALARKDMTRAEAATQIMAAAVKEGGNAADAAIVNNKIAVATNFTAAIDTAAEVNGYKGAVAAGQARELLHNVNGDTVPADYQATVEATLASIANGTGSSVALTNGTDTLTANIFNAGLVYTPSGSDRINSLQSEDVLTGKDVSATANNILNATLGNANDNGAESITATLKNIQTINLEITGNTKTLDVRFADSLKTLAINKLTAEASNTVNINNIGQPAANLSVKNSAAVNGNVNFNYIDGVLAAKNAAGTSAGGDTGNITVENVALTKLHVGNATSTEGFETINLLSQGTNTIKDLNVVDAETVVITGAGSLNLINNSTAVGGEYTVVGAGGITIGDGIGVRTINAVDYAGNTNINISSAVGGHNDPGNSGKIFHSEVKLGAGDDTLWTTSNVTSNTVAGVILSDVIDGGAGHDTLRTFSANVTKDAKITNVEALELRGASSFAYVSAFDANLTSALLRNEVGGAPQTFELRNTTKTLAENGNIVLRHGIGAAALNDVVEIDLADASGAADTVVLTVQNDLNTGTKYDYVLTAQSQLRSDVAAGRATATNAQLNATKVENITINDNDTESNIVTVTRAADHNGTVKLTGGTAGLDFTVKGTLIAATVDGSTQLSNLNLTVGEANQTIKLGSGNDTLTFDAIDTFNGSDVLSDVGGTDTVRAAFSKDVTGTPDLAGIEKLHIVATANTTLDLIKGQGITELAILSDRAVNAAGEIFTAGLTSVDTTDVITLKNTKLNAINFFGDADGSAADGGDGNADKDSTSYTQTFNGLTLENNTGDAVAVNIAAPLAQGTDSLSAGDGIKAYNLGQLTTHGVKDLTIAVANEYSANGTTVTATDAVTTIANIWDRDLVNLKLTARGSVNVGTVTGNTVNSNLKTFDAANVGGNLTAIVKALGDNAVVTLAGGDDTFNALGSAGNNVVINAGNGKNNIVGTAQSDYITTGTGNDIIDANRGNNTVKSGAGNDVVSALNGSNTVDVGSGWADSVTFKYDTVGQQNLATNVIAGSGTSAIIGFDSNNDGDTADATDATFGFAVGDGAELSVKFTGTTFDASASTLNGRSANVIDAAGAAFATAVEANLSNLLVVTQATADVTLAVTGGAAADVFVDLRTGASADAYDVSTGAGNDAIVIAQGNTGAHTINAGTGADRIVLSAVAGVDTIAILEGDSNLATRDIITNFNTPTDLIDVSGTTAAGTAGHLTSVALTATNNLVVSGTGFVTTTTGVIGATGGPSLDSVLSFLAANATTNNDVYFVRYDSNGSGAIDAADNVVAFLNMGTDIVVELVGSATQDVSGILAANFV